MYYVLTVSTCLPPVGAAGKGRACIRLWAGRLTVCLCLCPVSAPRAATLPQEICCVCGFFSVTTLLL